jgi:hypothetical protein
MTSAAVRLVLAFAAAAQLGCSNDHDLLAEKPGPPGPDGGAGGGSDIDTGFPVNPRDAHPTFDARDPEPPGPWVLTLMNGVVDVGPARFCFVPVVDGGEAPPDDAPLPGAPGLAFGAQTVLTHLAVDPRTTDLHPYLVVGADGPNAALSCKQLLGAGADGGTDARAPSAYSLPIVPAGTLGESRSYLAVANGCALRAAVPDAGAPPDGGDAGETGAVDSGPSIVACGTGLGPTTLGLTLVRLSRRKDYSRIGFQTVNGSNATVPAMLLMENLLTTVTIYASDPLELGEISPHAQPGYVSKGDFGATVGSASLSVVPPAGLGSFPEYATNLPTVLAGSNFQESDLTEGELFAFVLLGAQPRQMVDPAAAPFRIGLVRSAPEVGDD